MTTKNDTLNDELEAVNSIYGDGTVIVESVGSQEDLAALKLPELSISFFLAFPAEYPNAPPSIAGIKSTGGSAKGESDAALSILRDVLARIWTAGQVCLFDLVEEAAPVFSQHQDQHGSAQDHLKNDSNRSSSPAFEENPDDLTFNSASSIPPPAWILSEPLTFNKSTFIARACQINSLTEAKDSISHLLGTNKKVATATHNISAWRIQSSNSESGHITTIQDCDDDGETAAGGRLLHFMQLMDVWNVVVVVTRWYGGVKLGPDRFRVINNVAREALLKAGFAKEDGDKGKTRSKGKR